jgi:hypothetical protein
LQGAKLTIFSSPSATQSRKAGLVLRHEEYYRKKRGRIPPKREQGGKKEKQE